MKSDSDLDLLQAYLDGTLSDADALAVEARVKRDPAFARQLVRLSREEAVFSEWGRSRALQAVPPRRSWLPRPWVIRAAAVLLAVGIGALLLLLTWSPQEPGTAVPVATLEEVHGDVYILTPSGGTVIATAGRSLYSGEGLRTSGDESAAVIRYPDTSRLELGSDTLVRLVVESAAKKVNLTEGSLVADVVRQPEGRPMVLTTPHVEVRAQASRFSSASGLDLTRLDPQVGLLQVTRHSDGRSVEVPSGSYLVATLRDDVPGSRPFAPLPVPPRLKIPRAVYKDPAGPVQSLAVSPDGKTLATGGWDGVIRLWDMVPADRAPKFMGVRWGSVQVAAGEDRASLTGFTKAARAIAFAPDGKSVAAASEDKLAREWDAETGQERSTLKGRATTVTFLPDGTLVTVGGTNKAPAEVKLRSNGRERSLPVPVQREPLCVAASPDGRFLALGFGDGNLRVWDLMAGREVRSLQAHAKEIRCLAFSPDGKILATGGRDQLVSLWDTTTWMMRDLLPGHPGEVRVVAFAPDGRSLVSGGGNGMLKWWDLATGEEMVSFRADKQRVGGLAFSPDGRTLVTSGWEKSAKLWDVMADDIVP